MILLEMRLGPQRRDRSFFISVFSGVLQSYLSASESVMPSLLRSKDIVGVDGGRRKVVNLATAVSKSDSELWAPLMPRFGSAKHILRRHIKAPKRSFGPFFRA